MFLTSVADAVRLDDDLRFVVTAVIESDKEFFDVLRRNLLDFDSTLVSLVKDPRSDLGSGLIAKEGTVALGLIDFRPLADVNASQLVSLRSYVGNARNGSNLRCEIAAFKRSKAQVPEIDCLYLARVYVARARRRSGVGRELMQAFLEHQKATGLDLFLHVRRENTMAVRFYEALGFRVLEPPDDVQYLGMLKEAQ